MTARNKAYLTLLLVSAIWGIAGPVIKYTVEFIPAFVFLVYRFALSSVVALIALRQIKMGWPMKFSGKLAILVYCLLASTVSLGFLFVGYEHTSALAGSVIYAIYPIIVAVVGARFLHERVTKREKIGMSIALFGTTLVIAEPYFSGISKFQDGTSLLGNLLILAALITGVMLAVMAKVILRKHSNPAALTHLAFVIGLITLLPVALLLHSPAQIFQILASAPLSAHAGVWYMAFISGTIAYSLWHRAQKSIEIGETAMFTYTYPLFTIPLSVFWLKETVTPIFILSAAIIAIGVLIAETKSNQRKLA